MDAAVSPAPQRILIAVDAVDALPPAEARRFLEAAVRAAGRGAAVVAAADLTRLAEDPREIAESLFEAVFDVGAPTAGEDARRPAVCASRSAGTRDRRAATRSPRRSRRRRSAS